MKFDSINHWRLNSRSPIELFSVYTLVSSRKNEVAAIMSGLALHLFASRLYCGGLYGQKVGIPTILTGVRCTAATINSEERRST